MPKFKVGVVERYTIYSHKMFEAPSIEAAKEMAHDDPSWTDLDGWEESSSRAGESDIDYVIAIEEDAA